MVVLWQVEIVEILILVAGVMDYVHRVMDYVHSKTTFLTFRVSTLMRFGSLEPPQFTLLAYKLYFEITILRQFEIVEMHMQLFFGQSMLYFGQNYKKQIKSSKASLASWPCHHQIAIAIHMCSLQVILERYLLTNRIGRAP